MNAITIKIGNKSRDVECPESWGTLDFRTLHLFYSTLFPEFGVEFNVSAFTAVKLIGMAMHILNVDMDFMAKWEADCDDKLEFLEELREVIQQALAGLFKANTSESGETTYEPVLNLVKNPYPKLTHNKQPANGPKKVVWYYAAEDELANISIYELSYTFTMFESYLATGDESYANMLIATIYRPSRPETRADRESGWFGDRRQPLRKYEKMIDSRAKLIDTLPTLTRRLIVFWFASCRQSIITQYSKVFVKSEVESTKPGYGWGGLLLQLAGGPAGLDAIADQHYSNALTWLSMKNDEAEEMEAARTK